MKALIGAYLTSAELAARWRMSEGTIRNKRSKKTGPNYTKVGNLVLYNHADVVEYESAHNMKIKEAK